MRREQVFWGWGEPGAGPSLPEHATAFLREERGLDAGVVSRPVALEDVRLREPALEPRLLRRLEAITGDVRVDREARVLRCRGKSYLDLLAQRAGDCEDAPDAVVAPADHPLASLATVTWADLADQDMISEPRSSRFSHTVWTECRRAGFEPNVVARVHDAAAMLAFVEVGSAITVLPELAVLRTRPRAIVWRPLDPPVTRRLLAATRSGRSVTLAVASLLDELTAADPHASAAS